MNKSQNRLNILELFRTNKEMDTLYRTIILDCQTKTETPNCEDCIARRACHVKGRTEPVAIVHSSV